MNKRVQLKEGLRAFNSTKAVVFGGLVLSLMLTTGCYSVQNTSSNETNMVSEEPEDNTEGMYEIANFNLAPKEHDYMRELDAIGEKYRKEYDEGATIETVSTESLEAEENARIAKARQEMSQKYGKQHVDALLDEGKILVGTPEGLVKNHTQSTLINETQYTRTYKIRGVLSDWAATVDVNVKTGKVTAVRNRTL